MSTILENSGACGKLNVQLLNLLKKHGGTFRIEEDQQFSTWAVTLFDKDGGIPLSLSLVGSVAEIAVKDMGWDYEVVEITLCEDFAERSDDYVFILAAIDGNEVTIDGVKTVIQLLKSAKWFLIFCQEKIKKGYGFLLEMFLFAAKKTERALILSKTNYI